MAGQGQSCWPRCQVRGAAAARVGARAVFGSQDAAGRGAGWLMLW